MKNWIVFLADSNANQIGIVEWVGRSIVEPADGAWAINAFRTDIKKKYIYILQNLQEWLLLFLFIL